MPSTHQTLFDRIKGVASILTKNKPTTQALPVEILELIIPHIKDVPTLAACAKASRTFNLIATPHLYKVVRLTSQRALESWVSRPVAPHIKHTKHLELHFDLRYYRSQVIHKAMWVHPPDLRLPQLDSIYLTTSGMDFYKEDPEPVVIDFNGREKQVALLPKFETMHDGVDRLLFLLVGLQGPEHFRWRAQRSDPESKATSFMPGDFSFKESVNKARRTEKHPFPKTPDIIRVWSRTRTYDLPFFARPIWRTPGVIKVGERKRAPQVQFFSIPGNGLHKWIKAEYWAEALVEDLLFENGSSEIIIQIRGPLKKGKDAAWFRFCEIIHRLDTQHRIRLELTDERKETAGKWRKRIEGEYGYLEDRRRRRA